MAIPIKIPMTFFLQNQEKIQKFVQSHKKPQIAKEVLRKKDKARGMTLPDFDVCYEAIVIKTT